MQTTVCSHQAASSTIHKTDADRALNPTSYMNQGRRKSLKFQSFGNEVQDKNINTFQQLKIIQDRHEIADVYNSITFS